MHKHSTIININVQSHDFDLKKEYDSLRHHSANPGAIAIFSGLVREVYGDSGSDGPVESKYNKSEQSLTLEHYPGMTEAALQNIVDEAAQRWPLQACRVIHRVGTLQPGDQIVMVACSSAHRGAALAATEFIMDYLKTSAPFWKKQVVGDSREWVESRDSDYQARDRWTK
jgi:molybdopterin synthase catalytic subunit